MQLQALGVVARKAYIFRLSRKCQCPGAGCLPSLQGAPSDRAVLLVCLAPPTFSTRYSCRQDAGISMLACVRGEHARPFAYDEVTRAQVLLMLCLSEVDLKLQAQAGRYLQCTGSILQQEEV